MSQPMSQQPNFTITIETSSPIAFKQSLLAECLLVLNDSACELPLAPPSLALLRHATTSEIPVFKAPKSTLQALQLWLYSPIAVSSLASSGALDEPNGMMLLWSLLHRKHHADSLETSNTSECTASVKRHAQTSVPQSSRGPAVPQTRRATLFDSPKSKEMRPPVFPPSLPSSNISKPGPSSNASARDTADVQQGPSQAAPSLPANRRFRSRSSPRSARSSQDPSLLGLHSIAYTTLPTFRGRRLRRFSDPTLMSVYRKQLPPKILSKPPNLLTRTEPFIPPEDHWHSGSNLAVCESCAAAAYDFMRLFNVNRGALKLNRASIDSIVSLITSSPVSVFKNLKDSSARRMQAVGSKSITNPGALIALFRALVFSRLELRNFALRELTLLLVTSETVMDSILRMPGWPAYLLPLLQDLPRALTNSSSESDSASLVAARQAFDFVMVVFCLCHQRCFECTISNTPRALSSAFEVPSLSSAAQMDASNGLLSARLRITSPSPAVQPTGPEAIKHAFTTQALKLFDKCATDFTKVFPVSLRAALSLSSFDCYALPRSMLSVLIAKLCDTAERHFMHMTGKWANVDLIVKLVQSFIFEIPQACATASRGHARHHLKSMEQNASQQTPALSSTAAISPAIVPENVSLLDQHAVRTLGKFTPQSFLVDVAMGKNMRKNVMAWMPEPLASPVANRQVIASFLGSGSIPHAPGITPLLASDVPCFEFPLIEESSTIGMHWREPDGLQADMTLILVTIKLLRLIHVSNSESDADVPIGQNQWIPDEPVEAKIFEHLQQVSLPLLQETFVFLQLMQQRVQLLADNEIQQLIRMFATSTTTDARTRIFTCPFQ